MDSGIQIVNIYSWSHFQLGTLLAAVESHLPALPHTSLVTKRHIYVMQLRRAYGPKWSYYRVVK